MRPIAFLLLASVFAALQGADFVGNKACAACHAAIYRSYVRTPMARSSGKVGNDDVVETFERTEFRDNRNAYQYKVTPDYRLEFTQRAVANPIAGTRQLPYFIGSGSAARTFLIADAGFLFESPATFYSQSASWRPSPGFESRDVPFLTRPVVSSCLQCHASGIQPIANTLNAYQPTPFLENGVACERCHGAGGEHIAKGAKMVNPVKLAANARDSICAQCHLSGEVRIPKPGRDRALTPGELLSDDLAVFVRAGAPTTLRVTSHVENLAGSACKRSSGDKMWCGSCHDPHTTPEPEQKAAYFKAKCLTCHQSGDCRAAQAARAANGDDCTACHMPRSPTQDIQHVVFTDHSIRKKPTAAPMPLDSADLVPYAPYTATLRDQALAYAVVALRDRNAADRDRAIPLLKRADDEGSADSQALAYLAEFYRDAGDDAHALPLYQRVWQMDKSQYAAAAALGAYAMQRGDLATAIQSWRDALALNPSMVLVRVNLANALVRTGKPSDARAELEQALHYSPTSPEATVALRQLNAAAR